MNLNARRNTSVHGEWLEALDPEALTDAITAGRALLEAVSAYAAEHDLLV